VKDTSNDDIALQYGLTLLYGLIREQISNLTHRMMWGQAMLPTMSFLDEKHERPESIQDSVLSPQGLLDAGGASRT
jgi:pyrroline-5-carboxylate reductase